MDSPFLAREEAAETFAVPLRLLARCESRGLLRVARRDGVEGYEAADLGRLRTVVSLRRDLGVNLAGIEAVLRLRAQFDAVHARLFHLAREMEAILDRQDPDDAEGPDRERHP